jgi:hypothetical protein
MAAIAVINLDIMICDGNRNCKEQFNIINTNNQVNNCD